jgi:osmoprotectant transport system permease protein
MIAVMASLLGDFGDAIEFIFQEQDSVSEGVQVGGLTEMADLTLKHLLVSAVAVAAAVGVFVPLGLYLGHRGRGEFFAISASNVGRAVPSLALLAFFIAFLGIGFANVATVLFLLAIPAILTNTYVGVRQVDRDAVDAARGMGMTDAQIARKVELPLALPTIFAGIRLSTVAVLATAIIAPLADWQTLGTPITEPQTYGPTGQVAAAIVVAVVTLCADGLLRLLQRALTPKGLKLAAEAGESPRRKRRIARPTPTRRERTA